MVQRLLTTLLRPLRRRRPTTPPTREQPTGCRHFDPDEI
jgi:hypothetical protein